MTVDRVKFQDIVESQLPRYVREEFPLLSEFLKQYYISQEFQSGTYDIVQNIDKYVKLDEIFNLSNETELFTDVSYTDTTINTSVDGNFTVGFPDNNGLIQIDDEIIFYESKTDKTFEGCVRGFSGITSYISSGNPEELVFENSVANIHKKGAKVKNLNVIFLQEFFKKIKTQFAPGFAGRTFDEGVDQRNFVISANSFYGSKGTDESFKILFRALYGENVDIINPQRFLIKASDADYRVTKDLVIESIEGDPYQLENHTLYQESTGARGTVTKIEKIRSQEGDYYQIGIDIGYDRDINVRGTIYGEFDVDPKTKILNNVSIGQTFIDVDSTLGFSESGNLVSTNSDGDPITLSYTSKSIDQFYGVSGTTFSINEGTNIRTEDVSFSYVGLDTSNPIKVRIGSTLNEFVKEDDTYLCEVDDIIRVKSIGIEPEDERSQQWFTNLKTTLDVSVITEIDASEKIYEVNTFDNHFLYPGYRVVLYNDDGISVNGTLTRITSKSSFILKLESQIIVETLGIDWKVVNQVLKTETQRYPKLSEVNTNVLNTYSKFSGDTLVASNSLPSYQDESIDPYDKIIVFNGSSIDTFILKLTTNSDHGFRTGDAVYYNKGSVDQTTITPDGVELVTQVFNGFDDLDELIYYVERIDQEKIKLSRSRSDLYSKKYIPLTGEVQNVKFTYYPHYNKKLIPQKIVREILSPDLESGDYNTKAGFYNGIFLNGVELSNYKSTDKVFYGQVKSISIGNPGDQYDVINPPLVHIEDTDAGSIGSGATGVTAVEGNLVELLIVDNGFDYLTTPVINISGGDGNNASAEVNMAEVDHNMPFNAGVTTDFPLSTLTGGVSISNNSIGFTTFHKFRDNERVVYNPLNQQPIGGLIDGSEYYVSIVDSHSIKLHNTFDDANNETNVIDLTSIGVGIHQIESYENKKIVSSIVVTNPGSGYKNKQRQVPALVGVQTASDEITIINHGYETGQVVNYYSTGNDIIGLSTEEDYFVTKVDENNFKLSLVGSGNTDRTFFLDNSVYVNLETKGVGNFNYKPIVVSVEGIIGVSTRSGQDFGCKVQPIFRGPLDSVDITDGGIGYGSSEILNFNRSPVVRIKSGEGATMTPIISNGRIVDVVINEEGSEYFSTPSLVVNGSGQFASLVPITSGGRIVGVHIEQPGLGYVPNQTTITVVPAGSKAICDAVIDQWSVDIVRRDRNNIGFDDGFITQSNDNQSLEYSSPYTPRSLRESLNTLNGDGSRFFGSNDLRVEDGLEVDNNLHSPIVGWAYDGAPIYGPYGFANAKKGRVKQMVSGYELNIDNPNRPSKAVYPGGFFVEDYVFTNKGDLDKHNGRFCVTPDYPNGVYAYFTTVTSVPDSFGPFKNFKSPVFPYVVGPTFKFKPNQFNLSTSSNTDEYDIEENGWFRNTKEYHLNDDRSGYEYIFDSRSENEDLIEVTSTSTGRIENIGILTGGVNYKVNDRLEFNNEKTNGRFAQAKVERILGKRVKNIDTTLTQIENVEFVTSDNPQQFIGFSTQPHNLEARDIVQIDGLSDYYKGFDGTYRVGIRSDNLVLTLGVQNSGVTGNVTHFYVSGSLGYPFFRPNDILTIDEERVKILNIDTKSSRIRVLRAQDGTTGDAHQNRSVLLEDPRKFTINTVAITTERKTELNTEYYFVSTESVGVGTTLGTGVGTTVSISDPGVGKTTRFLEPQTIFIPDHQLSINDQLFYKNHGNTSIQAFDGTNFFPLTDVEVLYAAPLGENKIGVSTTRVGYGASGYVGVNGASGLLFFNSAGNGDFHSFETNFGDVVRAEVNKSVSVVSVASTHVLQKEDTVYLSVKPYGVQTVVVKYNDFNRRFVFDPDTFVGGDVDLVRNVITVTNHTYKKGDKVIYTSDSPVGGMENEGMYYVIPYDSNRIRFVTEKYEVDLLSPTFVDMTSLGNGVLSRINPLVTVKRNQKLKFDLSDSSLSFKANGNDYSGFEMNLYSDQNYVNEFVTSGNTEEFEVTKSGRAGLDSDANLTLLVSDNVPQNLWYDFEKLNLDILKESKRGYEIDGDTPSHNQIFIERSKYDGKYSISGIGSTTFSINLSQIPDVLSVDENTATISYETTSVTEKGRITKVGIVNPGYDYKSLPGVSSVKSETGSNAILYTESKSVGKILNTKYVSGKIAYDMPTDKTLKVVSNIPQILDVDTLASFVRIGISSVGRNYLIAPDLIVIDGFTNQVVPEIDIQYQLGDSEVTIFTNSYSLYPATPRIVPINNSNGVGILSAMYNESDKTANIFLDKTFSSIDTYPFNVGDEVFIENTSVGINSTFPGYNSSDYSYSYFRIVETDPNIGGSNGSVKVDMSEVLSEGGVPGKYDPNTSLGKIIKVSDLPIYDPVLAKNDFLVGEKIVSENSFGFVESWNPVTEVARVSTNGEFKPGDKLFAQTSGTVSFVGDVIKFESQIVTGAGTTIINGWQRDTGFLNSDIQVLPNNEYYQNFSYSIASKVPFEQWEDIVSSTSHPVGFQKFSDLQVESFIEEPRSNPYAIDAGVEISIDIISEASIHCFYDFDAVTERTLQIEDANVSKEIHFENKVLTDHFESIGNLVTSIDDISDQFNSQSREDEFLDIANFDPSQVFNRVYTVVKDQTFTQERQFAIYSLLQDGRSGYIQEYGSLTSGQRLGEFDYVKKASGWQIRFFPAQPKFNNYDVTVCTAGIFDQSQDVGFDSIGVGSMSRGIGQQVNVLAGEQENIVSFSSTYRSAKVRTVFGFGDGEYEAAEINIIHNDTDVHFSKFGDMGSTVDVIYGESGIGTYDAAIEGGNVVLKFTNNIGVAVTATSSSVLTSATATGISSIKMRTSTLLSSYMDIPASATPTSHAVGLYANPFISAVYYVTVSNITDGTHSFHEIVTMNTDFEEVFGSFGEVETGTPIGTFGITNDTTNTILTFTPIPNKNVQVRTLGQELMIWDGRDFLRDITTNYFNFTNNEAIYKGTNLEQTNVFELKTNGEGIFERDFNGSDSEIVGIGTNDVIIPNHLFETGQNIIYDGNQGRENNTTFNNISIAATVVPGIGLTDKLPNDCFAVKLSNKQLAFAPTAEDALALNPKTFTITGPGIGTFHRIGSKNEDERTLIMIDNMIQAPIANTNVQTTLSASIQVETEFQVVGISSFFPDDIVRIDEEFMMVISAFNDPDDGLNYFKVVRGLLGSRLDSHATNSVVTKITGTYHITRPDIINFVESPKGKNPFSTTTEGPDNTDWVGVTTNSSFQGRVFNRTSFQGETNENYVENTIFDDISPDFSGITSEFTLKNFGVNQTGISTDNILTLINGVFQDPNGIQRDGVDEFPAYDLKEVGGETIIQYQADPYNGENNTRTYPRGGILMEVGSSGGFGYQPLVRAGGTATVSATGTISAISIGNSGSGYRPGVQEVVNVGVQTYSNGVPSIEFIGTAAISGGHIVSVAITNPGSGYTSTSAPDVVFDEPLAYNNIPLVYAPGFSGIGTQATVDIVVGQGSSVIDFTLRDKGTAYGDNIKLTVGVGGTVGIPTFSDHSNFEVEVVRTQRDNFNGWYIGELEVFDRLDDEFNGYTKTFNLKIDGEGVAIYSRPGSRVDAKKTMLVFINNVLQEPGRAYDMQGGSVIRFSEAPKKGDTGSVYFYKGTRDKDVVFQDILETVKPGDTLNIDNNPALFQGNALDQNDRVVVGMNTIDSVTTNPYINPGVTTDTTIIRPVSWCKQLTDVIVDGEYIGKDRMHYEPNIFPFSYVIEPIGVTTTIVYVDSIKPLFDGINETSNFEDYQGEIQIVSQDPVGAGFATAVVNEFGQVESIVLSNPGFGYTATPDVSIALPHDGQRAFAEAVNKVDVIDKFNIIQSGFGYTSTNPPIVDIAPPNYPVEIVKCNSFTGDYGIIVGLGTGTSSSSETQVIFDFFIPYDSMMRDVDITRGTQNTSGINTGDFFTVFNSKTSFAQGSVVSLGIDNTTRIGLSTDSYDNIYQVADVETRSVNVPGVGTTDVRRVFTNVIGSPIGGVAFDSTNIKFDSTTFTMDNANYVVYSGGTDPSLNFGEYSWGKIDIKARPNAQPFSANTGNGYAGLSTSSYVRRFKQLKFRNYEIIDY